MTTAPVRVARVTSEAPPDWDAVTVDVPGGSVLQGTAWAEHRRTQGWTPRFVTFTDDRAALVLTVRQPPLPGFLAYAPRGPVSAGDPPERVAGRAVALAHSLRGAGATILAVDPELAAGSGYAAVLAREGFRPTEEIQPSRHRIVLRIAAGADEASVWKGVAKSTRQRIRAAEAAGTWAEEDVGGAHLAAFGGFIDATALRKGFDFATDRGFLHWWQRVLGAGQARFWVARNGDEILGGLLAYRQGGHLATAFSGDRADTRDRCPGTMHLLRWHAIREAARAGMPEMDLGGVDTPGRRARPGAGDPTYGLLQHKLSFGAEWVESEAAHEVVLRPGLYRAGLAARAARRRVAGTVRRLRRGAR